MIGNGKFFSHIKMGIPGDGKHGIVLPTLISHYCINHDLYNHHYTTIWSFKSDVEIFWGSLFHGCLRLTCQNKERNWDEQTIAIAGPSVAGWSWICCLMFRQSRWALINGSRGRAGDAPKKEKHVWTLGHALDIFLQESQLRWLVLRRGSSHWLFFLAEKSVAPQWPHPDRATVIQRQFVRPASGWIIPTSLRRHWNNGNWIQEIIYSHGHGLCADTAMGRCSPSRASQPLTSWA